MNISTYYDGLIANADAELYSNASLESIGLFDRTMVTYFKLASRDYGLESYYDNNVFSTEGVGDAIKAFFRKIGEFFKWIWEQLKRFGRWIKSLFTREKAKSIDDKAKANKDGKTPTKEDLKNIQVNNQPTETKFTNNVDKSESKFTSNNNVDKPESNDSSNVDESESNSNNNGKISSNVSASVINEISNDIHSSTNTSNQETNKEKKSDKKEKKSDNLYDLLKSIFSDYSKIALYDGLFGFEYSCIMYSGRVNLEDVIAGLYTSFSNTINEIDRKELIDKRMIEHSLHVLDQFKYLVKIISEASKEIDETGSVELVKNRLMEIGKIKSDKTISEHKTIGYRDTMANDIYKVIDYITNQFTNNNIKMIKDIQDQFIETSNKSVLASKIVEINEKLKPTISKYEKLSKDHISQFEKFKRQNNHLIDEKRHAENAEYRKNTHKFWRTDSQRLHDYDRENIASDKEIFEACSKYYVEISKFTGIVTQSFNKIVKLSNSVTNNYDKYVTTINKRNKKIS